jgi:hypothetical protein
VCIQKPGIFLGILIERERVHVYREIEREKQEELWPSSP